MNRFVFTQPTPPSSGSPGVRVLLILARLAENVYPQDVCTDDWDALGLYEVLVPANLGDPLAASCAMGGFHSNVPIKWLHTFDYTVVDAPATNCSPTTASIGTKSVSSASVCAG